MQQAEEEDARVQEKGKELFDHIIVNDAQESTIQTLKVCMYVCMCINFQCMYVCMSIHVQRMYVCMYIRMHVCPFSVFVCMFVCMHILFHCMYICKGKHCLTI